LELASENGRIVDLDDPPSAKRKEQLAAIFEISRHAIQLVETAQMAAETVDRMRTECESFAAGQKTPDRTLAQRARKLAFIHSMFRGLSARAVTNEKRIVNEQSLVRQLISFTVALRTTQDKAVLMILIMQLSNLIAQGNNEVLQRLAASNNDED
jgi:hypothetical protein